MTAIQINQLSFHFEHQRPIIEQMTGNFPLGQSSLLTGPSGCGKSTLLRLIAGLLPKYGGTITNGQIIVPKVANQPQRIGMLFQDPAMQFAMDTPRHELEFTLENCQVTPTEMPKRIDTAASFCHVTNLLNRRTTTLSGGQQQRVALAVVMAMHPQILLLDEPFASIDEKNRQFLIARLTEWQSRTGNTLIITDHDCHGYSPLHPRVYQFTHKQLKLFTPAAGHQLITNADQMAQPPLPVTIPRADVPAALYLHHLTIKRGHNRLIRDANLPIVKNKITLLTGANGTGKSTLFKALTQLIPYRGTINYGKQNIKQLAANKYHQQVGLVFQHANDQFLNVTVSEELALSAQHCHQSLLTAKHLPTVLKELGLAGMEDRVVYSLSGGQRKKLQLLVMLMIGHPVLLLDEPFTGLDHHSLAIVLKLLKRCQEALPQTIVIISHQLTKLDQIVDYHLQLVDHQLTYEGAKANA